MSHFICCDAHTAGVLLHPRVDSFGVLRCNEGEGYDKSSPP